jgi:hypothetical protein
MRVNQFIRFLIPAALAATLLSAQQYPDQQQQPPPYPQDQQQNGQDLPPDVEDGPGRGVARISLMNGEVSLKRGDTGDLIAAAINAPLMVSDRVITGQGSRAEIQFDSANLLRLSAISEVRMSELEWQRYMVQIAAGTVTFRVIRNSEAQVELNTPAVALRPLKKGEYRITVREDGTTEITVRSGELEIFTPRGSERLKSGRTMIARNNNGEPEFQVLAAIPKDEFDSWNQDRDKYFERSQSYENVSPDVYGVEDLDNNGTWTTSPQYGRVWVPRVGADWAPYRYGRWVYYDWYGWTWVSADSWGWAPYHYGRWFYDASIGWGWWPGASRGRHYWRPAYVSFFGWGNNGGFQAGIGFGFGNVGWVPLAPYEPCYGWWGRNRYNGWRGNGYYNNTRIVNNINITNIYRNARHDGAITSVRAGDFGRNRVYHDNIVRTRSTDLRGAGMVRGTLPVVPDRAHSTRISDREVRQGGVMPRTTDNGRFMRTREPARVDRVSFDDQRRGMEEIARRNFSPSDRQNNINSGGGNPGRGEFGNRPVQTGNENNGWRRANENRAPINVENPGQVNPRERSGEGRNSGGWRRFGDSQPGNSGGGIIPMRRNDEQRQQPQRQVNPDNNSENYNRQVERERRNSQQPRYERRMPENSNNTPRYEQPRMERPQQRERTSEPVRISPPIVRERSNSGPSFGGGGGGRSRESMGGGGGGGNSAPRMGGGERSGGGGGGGSRGGGGGERSGGGGGGGDRGSRGGGGGRNK